MLWISFLSFLVISYLRTKSKFVAVFRVFTTKDVIRLSFHEYEMLMGFTSLKVTIVMVFGSTGAETGVISLVEHATKNDNKINSVVIFLSGYIEFQGQSMVE
jgi:hypothetical protein